MSDPSENLWIVFNGEMYNFLEKRRELETFGVQFRTRSDTEVVLQLYLRYREKTLQHIRGMFAFAIWDEKEQRLFVARDRVGKKPLYYFHRPGLIVFASEIRAMLVYPEIDGDIDPVAFSDFLTFNYIPDPHTIYERVHKLPPAHYAVFDKSGLRVERYWDVQFNPDHSMNFEEAKSRTLAMLEEATKLRMISDVPLGAFLSGGIDSSLVVALMSRATGKAVKTFSIGFEDQEFNELPYARRVAEKYGTEHQEFIVRPDALQILPQLIQHFGEPFADSSAIPTYYLAQMTRQYVTVALNGDGGDEAFAGYDRYRHALWMEKYRRLPKYLRDPLLRKLLQGFERDGFFRHLRRFNEVTLEGLEEACCSLVEIHSTAWKQELIGPALKSLLKERDSRQQVITQMKTGRGGPELLGRLQSADLKTYLSGDLLVKMDRMTMAHSLEARSPFLDHQLIELAATFPACFKIRGGITKHILKEIARDLIPPELIHRPKQGFAVPMARWIRQELKDFFEQVLLNSRFVHREWLKKEAIEKLLAEHQSGRRDHSFRLWGLFIAEMWFGCYIKELQLPEPDLNSKYSVQ